MVYGGDFSFSVSNNYWSLGISPQVGYRFTDNFIVGAGIGY
ncbi:hypothetical protein [Apibacter muscae]|nr:hypothetical protein [Apibacter muscae]